MNFKNRISEAEQLQREINSMRPLSRQALKQLKEYYRIGLTYASNALEGNSLTETETKIVLEDGITVGGKPLRDHFEAIGHSEAFDLLYKLAKKTAITERQILDLHKLFYLRIDAKQAGRYRKIGVVVTGSTLDFPRPAELKKVMLDFITDIPKQRAGNHPVAFAAWLHIRLVSIHPFVDGNGMTARLVMNLALLQAGYPITIIPPVLRGDYLDALKASNRGDHQQFVNLLSNMVCESQRDYMRLLKNLGEG
ncbi:MAG: Fic family protein [Deltaproteobacteria bacterium]|nr:Fic family protein [Deltaproteobacteria bacterium]